MLSDPDPLGDSIEEDDLFFSNESFDDLRAQATENGTNDASGAICSPLLRHMIFYVHHVGFDLPSTLQIIFTNYQSLSTTDDEESTSAHHLGQHHRPEENGQVTEGHDDDD